ncbi:SDR family NAD(P)-dependent oxidoreductase [Pseudorhodoferax sp. Leaf265]|jgi:NAD(P)-dependent dehydrogenase (short-subunit alcohol dehydrogenase family)|uniref:SDR family NAD(P)-dependent oxidoreductase n=1 Tax=Pseudorhodoferax sp. Leaf265 TaxID=1736315 RepID=UPI0006F2360B|nr:SDR family oxidoreductase [Pseudorhodoferax sp. Leaf265]KQP06256.1 3-oxoacyl-ACP reductase [Pseudorhodoferax sp. Leaf265]PZQ02394.1 MAG: SDR family NAD(P)-dependent oxidoreductase [Variovorax paradoxus]PZQ15650.1 MAG: SDR family NAD(P)-dependent oxidoreductase [Variovorax paradoxus]
MHSQKVAIVTGASQGIGAGIVSAYRQNGFAVVATSRSIQPGADEGVLAVAGDIRERAVAERVVAAALERFGRIDTLVNNAGIFIGKPFTEYTVDDLRNMTEVNLAGFFHITQLVLPHMLHRRSGHIVQITTTLVHQAIAGAPSGLALLTKGGLDAVTRGLAIEYAQAGVRVNSVAPGIIKTPMHPAETHAVLAGLHPMGRMGEVAEIADAILYLENAAFVTGETINVDGGQHAGRW